jgi:hypothetical protein
MVRMSADELTQLDGWREAQSDLPSRPEALRRLMRKALSTPN